MLLKSDFIEFFPGNNSLALPNAEKMNNI